MGWWIKLIYFMNKDTYYYYLYYLIMLLFSILCRLKTPNCSLFLSLFTRVSFLIPLSRFPLLAFHFGLTYIFYSVVLSFLSDSSLHSRSISLSFILIITCSSLTHSLYANFSRFKRIWFIETVKIIPLSPLPPSLFSLPTSLPCCPLCWPPHLLSLNPRQAFSAAAPWPPL